MKGFNSLELFFKVNFVRKNGTLLIAIDYFNYKARLYSWDKFLIEVYYDNDLRRITLITLAGKKSLEKYLNQIDISELGRNPCR